MYPAPRHTAPTRVGGCLGLVLCLLPACNGLLPDAADGGTDAGPVTDAQGDTGDHLSSDSGSDGSAIVDGALQPDSATDMECAVDSECGDVEQFECRAGACVEHECHALRLCAGSNVCEDRVCVPFAPPERYPSSVAQTAGGGSVQSANYRLRLSVGAPMPLGSTSSSSYTLSLGPGANRR